MKICIYLHDAINQYQEFSDCAFVELIDFLKEYCSDFDDFGHSQARLLSLNYLSSEQLKYADVTQIKQLRDCALSVAAARNNLSVSEMFSTEIKFASECLLNWFNAKFKKENLQLSNERKKNMKLNNRLIGKKIGVVFVLFLLELIQQCQLRQKKQCRIQIL